MTCFDQRRMAPVTYNFETWAPRGHSFYSHPRRMPPRVKTRGHLEGESDSGQHQLLDVEVRPYRVTQT